MADTDPSNGVASSESLRQQALALWQAQGMMQNNSHWLPIVGNSMLPLLREGDQVLVARRRHFVIGDLVLFLQREQLIVHRVVGSGPTGASTWITQGDNCCAPDRPVPAMQMLGKVIAIRRGSIVHKVDSWWWRWVNPLIGCCASSMVYRPMQQLLLRICARYLRRVLKG